MAVFANSRFARSIAIKTRVGRVAMGERLPYAFHPHVDNIFHKVQPGDTLAALAGRYYKPLPRACGYWWAIAEFQPEPIINPLIPLHRQRTQLIVPALRVLTDAILRRGGPR